MGTITTRRRTKLALGLFLTSALSTVGASQPVLAYEPQQQAYDVFFASRYTYCDAVMIGKLWGIDTGDAKAQIGEKILTGIGDNIPEVLELSRQAGNQCEWSDLTYDYDDAERINQLWGLGGVDEAKTKIQLLASGGNQSWVDAALANPFSAQTAQGAQGPAYDVYYSSRYTYCDAAMVGKYWGMDTGSAKAEIGQKILIGGGGNVDSILEESRNAGNQCDWSDVPYSYEDAERISQIWDLGGVEQAKSKITMLATAGHQNWVDAALSR
ncbi:MAG: hypothetical protein WAT93_12545 [Pontixanthobacter sp.]